MINQRLMPRSNDIEPGGGPKWLCQGAFGSLRGPSSVTVIFLASIRFSDRIGSDRHQVLLFLRSNDLDQALTAVKLTVGCGNPSAHVTASVNTDVYSGVGSGVDYPSFRRSVLGCTKADFCNERLSMQHFSNSRRLSRFCTAPHWICPLVA